MKKRFEECTLEWLSFVAKDVMNASSYGFNGEEDIFFDEEGNLVGNDQGGDNE